MTKRVFFETDKVKSVTMNENRFVKPDGEIKTTSININIATEDIDPNTNANRPASFDDYYGGIVTIVVSSIEEAEAEMKSIIEQIRDQRRDDIHLQEVLEKQLAEAFKTEGKDDGSAKRVRKARGTKGSR